MQQKQSTTNNYTKSNTMAMIIT